MARKNYPFKCKCGVMVYSKTWCCPSCQKVAREIRQNNYKGDGFLTSEATKKYRENKPETYLLCNPRIRARKRGWEFNLEPEDVIIPTHCPVFGVKLDPVGSGTLYSPSIDRIDCTKGYIKGNIRVISFRANTLLSDGKLEEFEKIVEFLRNKNG